MSSYSAAPRASYSANPRLSAAPRLHSLHLLLAALVLASFESSALQTVGVGGGTDDPFGQSPMLNRLPTHQANGLIRGGKAPGKPASGNPASWQPAVDWTNTGNGPNSWNPVSQNPDRYRRGRRRAGGVWDCGVRPRVGFE